MHFVLTQARDNIIINDMSDQMHRYKVVHLSRDEDLDPDPLIFGHPGPVLFYRILIRPIYEIIFILEQNINQNQPIQA